MSKITIIVPIYQVKEEHLKKCVISLQQQTLKDIEIILVDDGADKIIANICDEYSSKDERIKVIHKENKGVSSARNEGIKMAKSDNMKIIGNVWTKLYSKKILKGQYFNTQLSYGEDVEFNFRIFTNIGYIFVTNEKFYHYRIQDSSSVRKYNEHMISNYEETLKSMKSYVLWFKFND